MTTWRSQAKLDNKSVQFCFDGNMTDSNFSSRLDRIEALFEQLLQRDAERDRQLEALFEQLLQRDAERDRQLEEQARLFQQRDESNARAIEALASDHARVRQEMRETMRLQAENARQYARSFEMQERLVDIVESLHSRQQTLIELSKSLSDRQQNQTQQQETFIEVFRDLRQVLADILQRLIDRS